MKYYSVKHSSESLAGCNCTFYSATMYKFFCALYSNICEVGLCRSWLKLSWSYLWLCILEHKTNKFVAFMISMLAENLYNVLTMFSEKNGWLRINWKKKNWKWLNCIKVHSTVLKMKKKCSTTRLPSQHATYFKRLFLNQFDK